jgi:hypothetical protein
MLPLPETGVQASRSTHNCDLQLFCDWIEGCLLFKNERRLSRTDLVDIVCEQEIYDDQAFANDWLDIVWRELERRRRLLDGAAPFEIEPRAIERKHTWKRAPAYAFCVLTPLLQKSAQWRPVLTKAESAAHYAKQGALFERISEEALRGAGWRTHRTAWSSQTANRLPEVVAKIAQQVGEPEHADWARNVAKDANEAGLDLIFFRGFSDNQCGFPIYLTQCATGKDWDTKLHTPVLGVWGKLIDFAAPPQKAFALPHSLGAEDFRRITVKVQGIVLDRYRLHDAARPRTWCSRELARDLKEFLSPLISHLPDYA